MPVLCPTSQSCHMGTLLIAINKQAGRWAHQNSTPLALLLSCTASLCPSVASESCHKDPGEALSAGVCNVFSCRDVDGDDEY